MDAKFMQTVPFGKGQLAIPMDSAVIDADGRTRLITFGPDRPRKTRQLVYVGPTGEIRHLDSFCKIKQIAQETGTDLVEVFNKQGEELAALFAAFSDLGMWIDSDGGYEFLKYEDIAVDANAYRTRVEDGELVFGIYTASPDEESQRIYRVVIRFPELAVKVSIDKEAGNGCAVFNHLIEAAACVNAT